MQNKPKMKDRSQLPGPPEPKPVNKPAIGDVQQPPVPVTYTPTMKDFTYLEWREHPLTLKFKEMVQQQMDRIIEQTGQGQGIDFSNPDKLMQNYNFNLGVIGGLENVINLLSAPLSSVEQEAAAKRQMKAESSNRSYSLEEENEPT